MCFEWCGDFRFYTEPDKTGTSSLSEGKSLEMSSLPKAEHAILYGKHSRLAGLRGSTYT